MTSRPILIEQPKVNRDAPHPVARGHEPMGTFSISSSRVNLRKRNKHIRINISKTYTCMLILKTQDWLHWQCQGQQTQTDQDQAPQPQDHFPDQ